jgi:hypothetical protein
MRLEEEGLKTIIGNMPCKSQASRIEDLLARKSLGEMQGHYKIKSSLTKH